MKKIYNETGRLTEEGKRAARPFLEMVNNFVSLGENETEVRLIGSILSSMIGEIVSEQVVKKK